MLGVGATTRDATSVRAVLNDRWSLQPISIRRPGFLSLTNTLWGSQLIGYAVPGA